MRLVAEVDCLITEDEYFRKTINRIRSGQQPYDGVKRQLQELVGQVILGDAANVTLPEARRVPLDRR